MSCETLDISGGVKFFDFNRALFKNGNAASASSNDFAAKYVLDISKYTRWESSNSNDSTTETITINFNQTTTIDRLLLIGFNFKEFTIKYNGSSDFANVSGIDGSLSGGISETTFSSDTAYYSFDSVSIDSIDISVLKTQVVDAEKFLTQLIATVELGTLAGFPRIQRVAHNRNIKSSRVLSGKRVIQKSHETSSFNMNFRSHSIQADIDLMEDLHLKEDAFLVWLCGGRYGSDHFTVEQRGWRLEDVYQMQISRPLNSNYEKSIYVNGANKTISFVEVV